MTRIFDARGNLYAVASPQDLRDLGILIPDNPGQAAQTYHQWAPAAIAAICAWPAGQRPAASKAHRSDGLLIGPFDQQRHDQQGHDQQRPEQQMPEQQAPEQHAQRQPATFDVLIVNTDATLAERSGNGLTIFAQALTDSALVDDQPFTLQVHHNATIVPLTTTIEPATRDNAQGFWLSLGTPQWGPQAVGARIDAVESAQLNGRNVNRVPRLNAVHPAWTHSVFVRVGNPHCVTLVSDAQQLPEFDALHEPALHAPLTRIAFAAGQEGAGEPCPAGVNLQWAWLSAPGRIEARVFERGEGPTASSGTSASAVACAAWAAGWIQGGEVQVSMPGGTAPVRLDERDGVLLGVALFGVASLSRGPQARS